jgi:hypothetical protein
MVLAFSACTLHAHWMFPSLFILDQEKIQNINDWRVSSLLAHRCALGTDKNVF